MIASLNGTVADKTNDYIVLIVNDIGYQVYTPNIHTYTTGDTLHLYTHLVVREDALTLFGFLSQTDRQLFETLIAITGVGPKVALAILSTLSYDNLRSAVVNDRPDALTRVPGIGKKTAQKIMFELKDRLKLNIGPDDIESFTDTDSDIVDALVGMGYSIVEAQAAVQALPKDASPDLEERLLLALRYFS